MMKGNSTMKKDKKILKEDFDKYYEDKFGSIEGVDIVTLDEFNLWLDSIIADCDKGNQDGNI